MSEVEPPDDLSPLEETGERNDGVRDAIADMVGTNEIAGRYLLVALALAVAWWQTIGALSAWVAGLGLIVLSFTAPRVLAAVSSLRWPTAEGVVVESQVLTEGEARASAGLGHSQQASETGYVPLIHYQFTVDGTTYESARVSPFDGTISRRRWASALVDRYPRNTYFSLRYDPSDPSQSYIRSWVRTKYVFFLGIGATFLAGAIWFASGRPGGAPALMTGIGLLLIAAGLHTIRVGFGSRNWPSLDAIVTATDVSVSSGGEESDTTYSPEITYEYDVDDTAYVGSRYSFGSTKDPSFTSREQAEAWIEEHCPVDSRIPVHYDPDQPGVSVVEPGVWRSVFTILAGGAFLGGAVLFYVTSGASVPV
jgi:hypothetical protein